MSSMMSVYRRLQVPQPCLHEHHDNHLAAILVVLRKTPSLLTVQTDSYSVSSPMRERLKWKRNACLGPLTCGDKGWDNERKSSTGTPESAASLSWPKPGASKFACLVAKWIVEDGLLSSSLSNARRLSIILHARRDARNCWNLRFFILSSNGEDVLWWKRNTCIGKKSEYWCYRNDGVRSSLNPDMHEEQTHRQCICYDDIRYR